ncbi:DUF1189 family protein [Legionella sp. km772]|uniref:DUF1189 family protein n=1 Tax=Legionella sp. km772 TaxID=2498111 RepID=UPI000F8D16F0|nr:DUF1189 family protein [Legionella sp. km772]RUR10664.1 DUF1189 domain-containing protein [Legionella sp. km772]
MAKVKDKLRPIDAPIYSIWQALYLSFFSIRLYIDVGKRWTGYGIRYLLLLIALWSIPMAVKMGIDFNQTFNQQLIEPLSIIPTIYIQNGQASFDKPMPYLIKNKKGEVVLIVDTTGKVNDFTSEYPKLTVLINKDKVAFRMPGIPILGEAPKTEHNKPLIQSFNKGDNLVFNGKQIVAQNSFSQWKIAAQLMIYPLVFSVFFGMFLFMFLVFGFLGQLFARIFFSFHITVKTSARLLMVATTPMMLTLLIMELANLLFPGFGFLLVVILAAYFSFAVFAFKSESRRMVNL